jgi:hypothetical protein
MPYGVAGLQIWASPASIARRRREDSAAAQQDVNPAATWPSHGQSIIGGMIDTLPAGLDAARRRHIRLACPGPAPEEPTAPVLALRAAELLRAVETGAVAPLWRRPGFGRAVDEIRDQLGPIERRGTLAASFGQEAARRLSVRRAASEPLDIAYAVRWLELDPAGVRPIPAWTDWLPAEPG